MNNDSHFRTILQDGPGCERSVPAARTNQTDAAGVARQPDYHRADRRHLPPLAGAAAGVAAVGGCYRAGRRGDEPSRGYGPRRLRTHDRRSANLHGRFHATQHMAIPGRPRRHRHTGRAVLQTPAGFTDRRFAVPATIPAWVTRASAPTVEICNSDKPYMPLAMKQHVLGPYPLDPNLLAQGVPPDDRVTSTTESLARCRERRCHRGRCRAARRRGRGEKSTTRHGWSGCSAGAVVGTTSAGAHVENVG